LSGIVSALTVSDVHAQGFDIGARLGGNFSYFHQNPSNPPLTSPVGVVAGIQVDYWLNTAWALSGQILYVQKKASSSLTEEVAGGTANVTATSSDNYIEIPIEAKLRFSNEGSLRPYVFAGVTVSFLYSARTVTTTSPVTTYGRTETQTYDNKNGTSSNDVGVIGGAGLDFILPSGVTIFAEGGYRFGFIYINDMAPNNTVNDLRFSAGIVFPI
jgi:outer membrane protein W